MRAGRASLDCQTVTTADFVQALILSPRSRQQACLVNAGVLRPWHEVEPSVARSECFCLPPLDSWVHMPSAAPPAMDMEPEPSLWMFTDIALTRKMANLLLKFGAPLLLLHAYKAFIHVSMQLFLTGFLCSHVCVPEQGRTCIDRPSADFVAPVQRMER